MTKLIEGNLNFNFADPDDVEIQLLDIAHTVSMDGDPVVATHGRCLKALIPAWIGFIKEEMGRDEEHGPGNTVYAFTRASSLLTAVTALGTLKDTARRKQLATALSEIFTQDIGFILVKGKVNGISGEHESSTTH